MIIYSIILNVILITTILVLIIKYKKRSQYIRQLFGRAWYLETSLMDIYNHCDTETQSKIEDVLGKIKPL